jgi:hypothetical protein
MNMQRILTLSLLVAFSLLFLGGCATPKSENTTLGTFAMNSAPWAPQFNFELKDERTLKCVYSFGKKIGRKTKTVRLSISEAERLKTIWAAAAKAERKIENKDVEDGENFWITWRENGINFSSTGLGLSRLSEAPEFEQLYAELSTFIPEFFDRIRQISPKLE